MLGNLYALLHLLFKAKLVITADELTFTYKDICFSYKPSREGHLPELLLRVHGALVLQYQVASFADDGSRPWENFVAQEPNIPCMVEEHNNRVVEFVS